LSKIPDKAERLRKWDDRYLALASHVAEWSKDPKAKVGSVLVDPGLGRVIALGFNGFPSNVEDSATRLDDKEAKLPIIVHAEQNALLFAGRDARGCELYVVGKPICNLCAILAIQSGVRRVIAAEPKRSNDSHWDKMGLIAIDVMREAKVIFDPIRPSSLVSLGLKKDVARQAVPPMEAFWKSQFFK
jgi:dCMP deaminase